MKENRISDNLDILLTMFERSKIGELQKFSGHVRDFLTNEVERTIKSAKTTLYLNDKKIYAHFAPYTETKWSERIRIDENGDGFIATYIPKAEVSPLMSTVGNSIYIRSGSNNVPAPYSVIAGMFGRRPQPNIELIISDRKIEVLENSAENKVYNLDKKPSAKPEKYVKVSFSVHGQNDSSVIARELYLSCTTSHYGSEHNKVRFLNYNQMDSIHGMSNQLNLITRPELRLPPRSTFKFTNIEIILTQYTDDDFLFDGIIGADSAAPRDFRIYINKNTLRSFVARVIKGEEDEHVFYADFFSDFLRSDF